MGVVRAIAKGMDDVHSHQLLGRILGKQGRFAEAASAYRKAVRHDPSSLQAQRELADLVWMLTGDLAKARAECVVVSCASVEGATGVSAPIFGPAGEVRAAVSIAGLSVRIERNVDKLTGMVRVAAEQMSRVLGFAQAYPPNPPS